MSRITIDDMEEIGYHSSEGADRLWTLSEICEYLSVPKHYIYRLTHEKKIPHIKMMGRLRFRRSEIDDWICKQEVRIGVKETNDTRGN